MKTNVVYCGDCKDILIEKIPEESIDLIYLDPPFFSGVNYEKIWKNGAEDKAYQEYWKEGINGFIRFMEGRLSLCKDVLKPTGSIYLHCDWHASAHLRLLMDRIFGEKNFRNEIVWHYTKMNMSNKNWIQNHDTIFFYTKTNIWTFNVQFSEEESALKQRLRNLIDDDNLIRWKSVKTIKQQLLDSYVKTVKRKLGRELNDNDIILDFTIKDKKKIDNVWYIPFLKGNSKEYLNYPTQKPKKLLERIIKASTNKDDIVLDPMMGGGTVLAEAEELKRKWIGIDVSPIACEKTLTRLGMRQDEMIIIPNCFSHLEKMSPEVFQHWVVRRLGGQPSPTISVDGGIDGYTSFDMIPIQVKKSRDIGSPPIRQFATDIQTRGKKKGIFVALSFNDGAKKIIHELYNKLGVDIELKTAEDMIK